MINGKNNLKLLWDIAGTIINPSKMKKRTVINSIQSNGQIITKNEEIANTMNRFFSTIGENLAKRIKSKTDYKIFLKNPNKHSIEINEVDYEEVVIAGLENAI